MNPCVLYLCRLKNRGLSLSGADNSASEAPIARPRETSESVSYPRAEGYGTDHTQQSEASKRFMALDYNKVKEWVRSAGAPRVKDSASPFETQDSMPVYCAQNTFWSMASPIYTSKLLRKLVTPRGPPDWKSESGCYQESSSFDPNFVRTPTRVSRALSRPGPQAEGTSPVDAEHMSWIQLEWLRQEILNKELRSVSPVAPALPYTLSDELSFRSFSVTGKESAKLSQQTVREGIVRDAGDGRRYSTRDTAREPPQDDTAESSRLDGRRVLRRVSFAKP